MAYAHSKNRLGRRQELVHHLLQVAEQAARLAEGMEASQLAYYAGLLHDIGKWNPEFQAYLLEAETSPETRQHGPDHKGAGAYLASEAGLDLLCFLIKGHHGGLPSVEELKPWLRERATDPAVRAAIAKAQEAIPELRETPPLPSRVHGPLEAELFIRMLFSALVDADFLDTEAHFAPSRERARSRTSAASMGELWRVFEADQQRRFSTISATPLNVARREVYEHCVRAAELGPGFFRLTVPTGGGKTRSSLAFALRHAVTHGLIRVIHAIPFTSITEQTADEFRAIFPDDGVVLEHHSAVIVREDDRNSLPQEMWTRLAAENWDAPLIVTTTVRLFESLLARSLSACRRLHNIASSVIILDEAQMLPTHVLNPILDVLGQLVAHYGTSVVLCTATQPALDKRAGFPGITGVRDIVPDPERLFATLKRVEYIAPVQHVRLSWEQVAERMRGADQAPAIVNTRADAVALLAALDDPNALHLSTWMCGAHRRAVLREVRQRLTAGEPCRLVATQVVEAGVHIDFQLVLRALGPLDRIVQAAGRCNREGRWARGTVIIFDPEDGHLPPGPYLTGTALTRALMYEGDGTFDFHDPDVYRRYFERYYGKVNLDEQDIQRLRARLDYPEVAERFHLIADDTTPVVVLYSPDGSASPVPGLPAARAEDPADRRDLVRLLQPYMVGLRERDLQKARQRGLVEEVMDGMYLWHGKYDAVRGIVPEGGIDDEQSAW